MRTLLLTAALAAGSLGGDTPIEPITSTMIDLAVLSSDFDSLCGMYPQAVQIFGEALDDPQLASEIIEAWAISLFEEGFDPTGNTRMTSEARDAYSDALRSC